MECWEAVLSPVSHDEVTKLPVPHPTAAPAEGLPVWSKLPTITLSSKQATCYLGRGTLTGLKDTRLSRKQVKLTLDPSTGFIHAASEGLNPSSVHCKDQMSALEVKRGAGSVLLPDGAILSLLPGLYGYRLTLTKRSTPSSSSSQPSSPSSGSSSSNASAAQTGWLKKRKRASLEPSTSTTNGSRSDNDADEEAEDKPAKEEKRRRSADSAVVPSQRQEAAITDITIEAETIDAQEKEKKQENGDPDAELDERTVEEKVHAITEVLPDIPKTRIRTALENLKFNVVNTIEWLLANASLTTAESSPSASRLQTSFSSPATTPSTPRSSSSFSSVSASSFASASSSSSSATNTSSTVKPADDGGEDGVLAQELQKAYDAAAEKEAALKRAEEEAKSQSIIIEMLMKEKKDMEEKSRELQGIQIELEKLYLPGEREALKGDAMKIFTLLPHRQFESTAEQYHFRIAESQFFRLCESGGSGFTVTKVEYVVNPPLVRAFEKKRLELAEHMEWEESKPLLCFHGTAESNISNIIKHNFDFSKIGASTGNMGFYGKGIYFSEYSSYSMPYVRGGNKLLLCKVLVGRACKLSRVETGVPCREGFDSHTSPCGKEIVVFSPGQILPIYVIHYTAKRGTSFFG